MVRTTRAQRVALKRVYDRCTLYHVETVNHVPLKCVTSYRQFRKQVVQFDYDAIGIQWMGMWLGIETDGYTHS